jgi:hypothetical protein
MNFFDAVTTDNEVVTSTDLIRACMDETFDGITIQDKLREMLVNPDSENCHLFEEGQKKEWIYHLLKLVCVGGAMCQAEDKFAEYKEVTKAIYKDTVSVQKVRRRRISGERRESRDVVKLVEFQDCCFPSSSHLISTHLISSNLFFALRPSQSAKTGKVEITSACFQVDEWGGKDELWKKNR